MASPCKQDTFERVWEAFHATRSDVVKLRAADLAELWHCEGCSGAPPFVRSRARVMVTCDRAGLFAFLATHHRRRS